MKLALTAVTAVENGLVAHYLFSGNALDASGFGNHGTVSGPTLTTDRFGVADSAYQFDGLNDGIRVNNSATLSIQQFLAGYSIAAWVRPDKTTTTYYTIVSKDAFVLRLNGSLLEACHGDPQGGTSCQTTSTTTLTAGSWSHVAVTWDPITGIWQMYLNGVAAPFTGHLNGLGTFSDGDVTIGRDDYLDRWYFAGKIDDVRLYTRALSALEVRALSGPVSPSDAVVDFGSPYGTWIRSGATWTPLHSLSPVKMVTGDLDGNGADDLVIDFGSSFGVWVWMNHISWYQLHSLSPTQMTTGDLDNNDRDDVILDFPGLGVWIWRNNTTWTQLHQLNATHLATGELNGVAGEGGMSR